MSSLFLLALPALGLGVTALAAFLSARLAPGTGDHLPGRQVEQPLAHELPYWAFLDAEATGRDGQPTGVAVHVDLTYSASLELTGIDTDCLDADALNQISLGLHSVVQGLAPGVILQFSHWTDGDVSSLVEVYRAEARGEHELGRVLVAEKADALLRSPGLRRSHLLLTVSTPAPGTVGMEWLGKFSRRAGADALTDADADALTDALALTDADAGTGIPSPAAGARRRNPTPVPDTGARAGSGRRTRSNTYSRGRHDERVNKLATTVDQVTRGLDAAGITSRPLSATELRQHIYQRLNPTRAALVPDPLPAIEDQTAREQLLYSGISEERASLHVDGQLLRVLTLKALPTATEPALLESLLVGLPFHCLTTVAIEATDSIGTLEDLKRRRDQAHLLATLREKRNQEAEAQEEDVAELIDRNLRSSVRMVRVAMTIVLAVDASRPDAMQVLDGQTHEVIRLASGLFGAQMMVDEHAQLDELLATLPGNARRGQRWRRCTSENAAHLTLGWQAWSGDPRPSVLWQNGRGDLVGVDPFDERLDNPNAFMAGASGSGKSATTNSLLLHLIAQGAKALVIEVGGSYRRIMDVLGGRTFAISLDRAADHALNPFFAPDDIVGPEGALEERRLQLLLAVLERMACDARRPELGNAERSVLAVAVATTYRQAAPRTPILSDLASVLRRFESADAEDVAIAQRLARDLRVWTEGPAARLVNRPSTIALTTDLAAFDLKGLEAQPDLQAVVLLILSGVLWNLVMNEPTEKKVVVFDEVWRLLESPAAARLVAELYRTSRKYRASILAISQSVEDFTASAVAGALTQNAATVYLLRHRRGHEMVAQQFHLNAREEEVFRGLEMRRGEYTEALVLHGEHHVLARIVLSPLEYWIATTHPADLALEARLGREQPHLSRLDLLRVLAARHPNGATSSEPRAAEAA